MSSNEPYNVYAVDENYRPPTVEELLNAVSYEIDPDYVPSDFALEFVNFIKLVDGGESENKTPVVHFYMIDKWIENNGLDTINLCHRGLAKSTLLEYLILYLAVFEKMPGLGTVPYGLYVSDSIDNGVKKMRKSLEYRWGNSEFLQTYIPTIKFTDIRWEFINKRGVSLVFSGHGAKTGVRGTRENGSRPVLALLDDLISDEDARSPTVIASVEDTITKAIEFALHPKRRKVIWNGTPFNQKDPLYKAVESGAYNVNIFPVCEKFPCTREEFRGSWPDRFDYDYVMSAYEKAAKTGKLASFYQELMLRIMSDEERLVRESDIRYYRRKNLLDNKEAFNFYITTDFATSEKKSADFSAIAVWAINSNDDWFWVDGICKKQTMDKNIDDLFRLVQMWRPQSVGVEVSGQQKGFVSWIQSEMMNRNIYFTLASDTASGEPGLRPATAKIERFNVIQPRFVLGKIYFPAEMTGHEWMVEFLNEISLVTAGGIKSKHDDCIDTLTMLGMMKTWKPSEGLGISEAEDGMWDVEDHHSDGNTRLSSYIV